MGAHMSDCPSDLRHALEAHPIVPYYRVKAFLLVSLRLVLQHLFESEVIIPGELQPTQVPAVGEGEFHLYVPASNSRLHSTTDVNDVAALLRSEAERTGGSLAVTTSPDERCHARCGLLHLDAETHDFAEALHLELESMLRTGMPLLLVHEQREGHASVPFGSIIERTPPNLLSLGLYKELAVPLYSGEEHQRVCLRLLLSAIASGRAEETASRRSWKGIKFGWEPLLSVVRRALERRFRMRPVVSKVVARGSSHKVVPTASTKASLKV